MTLYQDLAAEVAGMIESGMLRPGEKIPSVRAMCGRRSLSQSTVLQAYHALEDRGLIEARPRSGYVVSAWWKDLPQEPAAGRTPRAATTVAVADLVFEIMEATRGRKLVPLGSAFPSPLLFPLPRLAQLLGSVARRLDPWATVTDLPPGNWELRRQIAKRYRMAGAPVAVEEIVITSGAMEALNLCLQAVTEPGDTVAVESPAFYGCLQALERRGLRALEVPTHPRDGVSLESLESLLDRHPVKACWFMSSFQNPLGGSMPEASRQHLVELLAARGIPLIEDDVYGELYFGSRPPRPAKAYDRGGLVLHCGSFAKCLAPGYRVGWAAPGRYAQELARLKFTASISSNVAAQETLARYLGEGGYEHHLRRLRQALQTQQNRMLQAVAELFPAGTRVSRPRGGYFLWLELPQAVDAMELHRQAVAEGIGIAPGPMFSAKQQFGHCIRLNCGHPWSPQIEAAMATLGRLAAGFLR
jgi:DNA-binding transcriptional MocR family regulator